MRRRVFLVAGCLTLASVFGCGSSGFEERLAVAQQEHRVGGGASQGVAMRLPASQPFNVADTSRSSTGDATASSISSADGVASCSVDATKGGEANAEIHVGHVLQYDGDQSRDVQITLDVSYSCTTRNNRSVFGIVPLRLKAYLMDSDRRVLGSVTLAESDPDRVPEQWTGRESPAFEVTLEPGLAYHMIVAGRVEATWFEGVGSAAGVKVGAFEIRIVPRN